MNYALITTVKNEETNLPMLAECVAKQTVPPCIWLILDDNSTDGTLEIIQKLENKHNWIKSLRLNESSERNLDEKFGRLCNTAFRHVLQLCWEKNLLVDFLAKVDADILMYKDCIEMILKEFAADSRLGIASPNIVDIPSELHFDTEQISQRLEYKDEERNILSEPSDGLRVYRKSTFEDIGGIPETMAPDDVAIAKARLNSWKAKKFRNLLAYKTRETGASLKNGYKIQGFRRYYLGYNPFVVTLNVLLEIRSGHFNRAGMITLGYYQGFLKRSKRIEDKDIKRYFSNVRLVEIFKSYLKRRTA